MISPSDGLSIGQAPFFALLHRTLARRLRAFADLNLRVVNVRQYLG